MSPMHESPACLIDVAYGDPNPAGLPVCVGVPFPRGTFTSPRLAVKSPTGQMRPAGGRVLSRWEDGSARWCLVEFGARESGMHEVLWDQSIAPNPGVALKRGQTAWTISTDRLNLVVSETGPGVISELNVDGHAYLSSPADLRFTVDDASTTNEARRTIRVIEDSGVRARLRVEGAHYRSDGSRCLNYRLDIEAWAGWPTVRLDYHYFHLETGRPAIPIRKIALETKWNLGPETKRHFLQSNYGLFYISRHVFNPAPVAIASDLSRSSAFVEDAAMLLDDVDYPFYLAPPLVGTHDWLGVGDGVRAVYIKMEDFLDARPNRLTSSENRLAAEVWPSTAQPLELPQGRSRRQTLMLTFASHDQQESGKGKLTSAPVQAPKGIASLLGAPVHEGRASVSPPWLAGCGEFRQSLDMPVGRNVRIEGNLSALVRLNMPVTKFDVGDTDSHYNSSYAAINEALVPPLPGTPEIPRTFPRSLPTQTYLDLREPVWTNNEYDVIHAFCGEVMRTGRFELWKTLRLCARHNIEVDFLHYSDHQWLHRATPAHSVRHTTTGAYPSHFWTQGLLEYYCLTGDEDALEVAMALGDKTIENFSAPELRAVLWGFNREIGWSVLLLACLYEVTREERFRPLLDEMVDFLAGVDRGGFKGAVNLSSGNDRQNLNRQIVGNFFGYASMVEGVDLYAQATGRKDIGDWLSRFCLDLADEAMNAARSGQMCGINLSIAVAVGHERTADPRFMQLAGLILDSVYWNGPGVLGGETVKVVAASYRGLTRMLGHAWRAGLLEQYEFPSLRTRG